jgi:hypothetical protein
MKFAKLKVRMWMLKSKYDNQVTKKLIPLKTWGSPNATNTLPRSAYLRKYKLKFGRKWESDEKFLQRQLASIRPLRDIRRTRVHSDVPRVTFVTEFQKSSWNRIVGVNPLPWGASVGEFRKNLSPSKCRIWRDSWNEFSGWLNITKVWNLEPAKLWSRESAKIWNLEPAKLWSRDLVKIWNLEPAKLWSHEPVKIWNLEPAKLWSHESAKIWNLEHAKPWSRESEKIWNWNLWKSEIYWRSNS